MEYVNVNGNTLQCNGSASVKHHTDEIWTLEHTAGISITQRPMNDTTGKYQSGALSLVGFVEAWSRAI